MQCSAPFGLLLDMKSRHVPRHVWAQVIDFLRDSGARVEGIGEFLPLISVHLHELFLLTPYVPP